MLLSFGYGYYKGVEMYKMNKDHEFAGYFDSESKHSWFYEGDKLNGQAMLVRTDMVNLPKEIRVCVNNSLDWYRGIKQELPSAKRNARDYLSTKIDKLTLLIGKIFTMTTADGGEQYFIAKFEITENMIDHGYTITRIIQVEGEDIEIPEEQYQMVMEESGLSIHPVHNGEFYDFYITAGKYCVGIIEQLIPRVQEQMEMEMDFGDEAGMMAEELHNMKSENVSSIG
jgi:hypothetical protein